MSADPGPSAAGVTIPGYSIRARLGHFDRQVVYRALRGADGVEVLLKTLRAHHPRARDVAELRREHRILTSLRVDGVLRSGELLSFGTGNLALEMESFGTSLVDILRERGRSPLPFPGFFDIAESLAGAIEGIHRAEVIHKELSPHNILVDPESGTTRIFDFGSASLLSRERLDSAVSPLRMTSLPYISPERTGRMSRPVDYRTDYYSFGAILFELLTGEVPFDAKDSLEWVHRHISHPVPLAHDVNPAVPVGVADVVAKLMAKDAEDRYQSVAGILADLERCRTEHAETGLVPSFVLATRDIPRSFQVPARLYGREEEVARLIDLFDDVAHGGTGFCVVRGRSGVGKSALVDELADAVVRRGGYLVRGKFDQLRQSTPYSALAGAIRGLVEQMIGEPEARVERWRTRILGAVGQNGRLLVDLVPEIVHILGEQPPVAELSPTEAQNRFHLVLIEFIRVVADRQHPLVLFLDDLQWSDVPTLALLRRLATARGLGYLCLVGAYRSNEVDVTHPLSVALDQVARSRELQIVALEPLSEKAVGELIADTLSIDVDPAAPLSDVVHAISGGNPFFIRELLGNLHERGAIFFDASTHGWSWDLDAVHSAGLGDGVVDLVVDQLRTLAEEDQHVLRLAACIGNRFDLTTLAVISEQSPEEVAQGLSESLRRNLVAPLTDDYRFVGFEEAGTGAAAPVYRFTHDRVQEAAYALIGEELRRSVHLSVGRLMLAHGSPEEIQDRLVDIVSHLNQGRALVDTPEERREIALLNLQAGEIAQASAAYESALGFLEVCRDMLPPDPWSSAYDLTLGLARQLQRCAYLNGDQTRADEWGDQILENARTTLERARALSTRTRQYATIGRMADSVDSALAGLRMLGIEIAENPDDEDIEAEIALVSENLGDRSVASLVDAPEVENAEAREALRLLMEVFAAAFLSGTGKLFPYLVLKGVNLALVNGSGPQSAFAYAAYGMILCGYMGRPALAAEYGQLGVDMNEKYDDLKLRARIIYVYAMFVHHWSHHWASMTPWFRRGIEAGYQSGDLLYLAYSAQDCIIWDPTLDLETASEEHRKYLRIVEDCDYRDSYDSGTLFLQMQLNFLGRTDGLYSMNTEDYDERTAVEGMRARGFMTGIANYQIYKAEIHALYGDWDGAMEFVRLQDDLMDSSMSLPQSVRFYMVAFLARARLWGATPEEDRPAVRARLERDLALIGGWAEHCRENFEHLRLTMLAELARLDGRLGAALEHYEAAVRTARESGFQRDEAVAAELAALCLQSAGLEHAAEGYVRQAYSAFDRWGARRKLARMEERWPWLTDAVEGGGADGGSDGDGADGPVTATALDLESVMKASRAIAGELVEQRLWATTLRILMENAGAERAWFVVRRDGGLHVVAEAEAGSGGGTVHDPPIDLEGGEPTLPLSVINATLRTGEALVLDDASESGRFASDPYFLRTSPRSVLCLPLVRAEKFSGAIYMENNLASGAFSVDRLEILRLLSAQATTSMENAQLYKEQGRLIRAQERFVPSQFLENLGHADISGVRLGEFVSRTMSVLFCDLRNFTPLAERLGPRAMIALLNRYFSRLADPIAETGGFIDSYNGDEVMALFGPPADQPVKAGIEMCRVIRAFNRELREEDGPELVMGVGVNTGPLVLGTVGGHDRLKCGVVGDTVNTASRIEQLTRHYDAPFLLGQQTVEALVNPDRFSLRRVDRVAVKGKEAGIDIHEVLDAETPERRQAKEDTRPLLDEGMEHYLAREFDRAEARFVEALSRTPRDVVLQTLLARAQRYRAEPPPSDWDGVEQLTRK